MKMSAIDGHQAALFWAKVQRGSAAECWNWQASRKGHGYGVFSVTKSPLRGTFRAHRVAYYLTHGPIGADSVVMHSCDNPACCNPAHLFLGSQQENMADMWRKGRGKPGCGVRGEKNRLAKLNEAAIRLIRASKCPGIELAQNYGVTPTLITRIRKGKAWSHVQ
jgi:hypothetical protein